MRASSCSHGLFVSSLWLRLLTYFVQILMKHACMACNRVIQ